MWISEEVGRIPNWLGVIVLGVLSGLFVNSIPQTIETVQDNLPVSAQISLATIFVAAMAFTWISFRLYQIEQSTMKELKTIRISNYEILFAVLRHCIEEDEFVNIIPDGGKRQGRNNGERNGIFDNLSIIGPMALMGSIMTVAIGIIVFNIGIGTLTSGLLSIFGGVVAAISAKYLLRVTSVTFKSTESYNNDVFISGGIDSDEVELRSGPYSLADVIMLKNFEQLENLDKPIEDDDILRMLELKRRAVREMREEAGEIVENNESNNG